MKSRLRFAIAAIGAMVMTIGSLLALTGTASAHERRAVGDYTFVVGFLSEPALLNEPNSIDLRISKTADSSPVTGAEKTLKAEIIFGSNKMPMSLVPRFGTPGGYNAYFTPTMAGAYTFHITGAIESAQIDQSFTSSPSTFSAVAAPVAFPQALPAVEEIDASFQKLQERVTALESKDSSGKANTAIAFGVAGVVIGVLGLGAGALGMTRRRA